MRPTIVDDHLFLLELYEEHIKALPKSAEYLTPETVSPILAEAKKLADAVFTPLYRSGDEEGCHLDNGLVRTPAGFKEAYQKYQADGWVGLEASETHGGQGLPKLIGTMVSEIVTGANQGFKLYPALTTGAYRVLNEVSSKCPDHELIVRMLATGAWTGTMCLTEPQAGTDLGKLTTKATPNGDGSYTLSGTKIFISGGDHDLTPNIIHLVLARIPDAPDGVGGISMFLVPRNDITNGEVGPRNHVHCSGVEHKMGIKASATCTLNFEGAKGWMLGEPNRGLAPMFKMMNSARVGSGMQGVAVAQAALDKAVTYAKERVQGTDEAGQSVTIIHHPDVKNNLMHIRSFVEGARALGVWLTLQTMTITEHPDETTQESASDFLALLTPVVKAHFTDQGMDACLRSQQIFGGHGYIREHGVEQHIRDLRITQLYEGTNGVQALDLVARKLLLHGGRPMTRWRAFVSRDLESLPKQDWNASLLTRFNAALDCLDRSTDLMRDQLRTAPEQAKAGATDYLHLFGTVALAHVWLKIMHFAHNHRDRGSLYTDKLNTGAFYLNRVLPNAMGRADSITSGSVHALSIEPDRW